MSKWLKAVFLVYAIITFIVGVPILLAPGRTLGLFAWDPIDPLITRLLGAALLAMAWGAWRVGMTAEREKAVIWMQSFAVFNLMAALGFLRHLLTLAYYPTVVWVIFVVLLIFGLLWVFALVKK